MLPAPLTHTACAHPPELWHDPPCPSVADMTNDHVHGHSRTTRMSIHRQCASSCDAHQQSACRCCLPRLDRARTGRLSGQQLVVLFELILELPLELVDLLGAMWQLERHLQHSAGITKVELLTAIRWGAAAGGGGEKHSCPATVDCHPLHRSACYSA